MKKITVWGSLMVLLLVMASCKPHPSGNGSGGTGGGTGGGDTPCDPNKAEVSCGPQQMHSVGVDTIVVTTDSVTVADTTK